MAQRDRAGGRPLVLLATVLGWSAGGVTGASGVWRLADWTLGAAQYAALGLPAFVYPLVTLAQAFAAFGLISGFGRIIAGFVLALVLCAIILPRTVRAGHLSNASDPWILLLAVGAFAAATVQALANQTEMRRR